MATTEEATQCPCTNLDINTTIKLGAKISAIVAIMNSVASIIRERFLPNCPLCKPPPIAPVRDPSNIILAKDGFRIQIHNLLTQ